MDYPGSVQFLYALGNEQKTIKFGLERIRTVLRALGNPQRACRFIHVAGTNGKGSTCAMIESGLRAAGYRTGLFTSPHLMEPTERIQVDNVPVTREEFTAAFDTVHETAERLIASGEIDMHTTYFETVTAMAFLLFRDRGCAKVVLEVGMGGRLDATNVVTPEICVITPVDYDHQSYLGDTIEQIAFEKAGILKPGVPAVFSQQRPEAAAVLETRAREVDTLVEWVSGYETLDINAAGSRVLVHGVEIDCPLPGAHQTENAATAATALLRLRIPASAVQTGIAGTRWPGRLELIAQQPDIYLDGAHNPAGARTLLDYISRFHAGRKVWMVFGAMRDKAVGEIAGILFPAADEIILTAPSQKRALEPEAIREFAPPHARSTATLQDALHIVRIEAAPGDVVFLTGSLYLVGEARALLVQ